MVFTRAEQKRLKKKKTHLLERCIRFIQLPSKHEYNVNDDDE